MKKLLTAGTLALLLVVPVLVYLFLKFYGDNHYQLITYYPLEVKEINKDGKVYYDTVFHQIPSFQFTDQNRNRIYSDSLAGKILICNFFFTRCPGICPRMNSQMTRVQEAFKRERDVTLLSFSVDPDYDKDSVLKNYAIEYGVIDNKWHLLTGNIQDVYNLSFYGFKLPADTVEHTLHSERIILVDKNRHIRGYYTGTDAKEIDRLITETDVLLYEYKHHP